MIRDAIQLILVLRQLCSRVGLGRIILQSAQLFTVSARRKRRRHVICEIQVLEREFDKGLEFVCEWTFEGEAFEMDDEHGRHARHCELFGGFAGLLAARTVPREARVRRDNRCGPVGLRTMHLRAP